MSGPQFIGVGAQKAGTSWIYSCMSEHPDIFFPRKEIHFFSREKNWVKGIQWYEDLFAGAPRNCLRGEFSTSYLYDVGSAARIHRLYPDAKIVVVLRDPIDRALSQFINNLKDGSESIGMPLVAALQNRADYVAQGLYYQQLSRYIDLFTIENVLVLLYEDIKSDPLIFIRKIYGFIGVDDQYIPRALYKKVNPARIPRFVIFERLMIKIAEVLTNMGLEPLRRIIVKSGISDKIRGMNTQTSLNDDISLFEVERQELYDYFKKDIELLESRLGLSLKLWRKSI